MLMETNQRPQASIAYPKAMRVLIEALSHAALCTKEGVISMEEHGLAVQGMQVSH